MRQGSGVKNYLRFLDSLIILIIAVIIWALIPGAIDSGETSTFTSPALFPKIIAAALAVLAIVQIIFQLKNSKDDEGNSKTTQGKGEFKTLFIGIALLVVYVLLIPIIGFLVATIVSVYCLIYFFGKPKWYNALLFTLSVSFMIYGLFSKVLNVPLPNPIFL